MTPSNPQIRPRILLAILSLSAGGAERVVSEMANWWAPRGHEVAVLTLWGSEHDHYALDPKIHRISLDFWRKSRTPRQYIADRVRLLFRIRKTIQAFSPDVVISFIDLINIIMIATLAGTKTPLIVSERIDPRYHAISGLRSFARRMSYPFSSALVVQTDSVVGWAEKIVPASKIEVIPNCVRKMPGKRGSSASKEPDGPFILAVGRLDRQKGYDVLIQAFAQAKKIHVQWNLVILGEGPERSNLWRLAEDLGIHDAVAMPGIVKEPAEWMHKADLFVLPSRYEGFPNALLEAMASGCAVIAADCPSGPAEIIHNGVNGLLVPRENVTALSAAMDRLMQDDRIRQRLSGQALKVKETFSQGEIMNRWDALIQKVLDRSK